MIYLWEDEVSSLHFAAKSSNIKIMKLLIKSGANVNARDKVSELFRACLTSHDKTIATSTIDSKYGFSYHLIHSYLKISIKHVQVSVYCKLKQSCLATYIVYEINA